MRIETVVEVCQNRCLEAALTIREAHNLRPPVHQPARKPTGRRMRHTVSTSQRFDVGRHEWQVVRVQGWCARKAMHGALAELAGADNVTMRKARDTLVIGLPRVARSVWFLPTRPRRRLVDCLTAGRLLPLNLMENRAYVIGVVRPTEPERGKAGHAFPLAGQV